MADSNYNNRLSYSELHKFPIYIRIYGFGGLLEDVADIRFDAKTVKDEVEKNNRRSSDSKRIRGFSNVINTPYTPRRA